MPFGTLDALPVARDVGGRVRTHEGVALTEDVGMTAHYLSADGPVHVAHVEDAALRSELGVQDDLEEEISELFGEARRRALLERFVDLVGLFEKMPAQGDVVLLAIPRAA